MSKWLGGLVLAVVDMGGVSSHPGEDPLGTFIAQLPVVDELDPLVNASMWRWGAHWEIVLPLGLSFPLYSAQSVRMMGLLPRWWSRVLPQVVFLDAR